MFLKFVAVYVVFTNCGSLHLIVCDQYESKLVPPSEDYNIFMASGTFDRVEQFPKKDLDKYTAALLSLLDVTQCTPLRIRSAET